MTELAAHLDQVIPDVPVRPWVLSLSWSRRYLLAFDAALCRDVLADSISVATSGARRWPWSGCREARTVSCCTSSPPRADGATHLLLDPQELLQKLAGLVPAALPPAEISRRPGAPNAAWRSLIVPRQVDDAGAQAAPVRHAGACGWAEPRIGGAALPGPARLGGLLKRVFAVNVLHCPHCGGRRQIVAVHTRPDTLRALLARLGLGGPPPCAPPWRSPRDRRRTPRTSLRGAPSPRARRAAGAHLPIPQRGRRHRPGRRHGSRPHGTRHPGRRSWPCSEA
jgi:hypothetical protein